MDEADLVIIVHAKSTRRARDSDNVVPMELVSGFVGQRDTGGPVVVIKEVVPLSDDEVGSFTPIITKLDVLAVVKGKYDLAAIELCHYKYKANEQQITNGPRFVDFDDDRFGDDYILFLNRNAKGRWTFVTGHYDPVDAVRHLSRP
jgi:hypothetical protein